MELKHKALLEIGTEEIPAKLISDIHENLLSVTEDILAQYRIEYRSIDILGSPRRLAVIINDLSEYQGDLVEEIKGPPCNIAFDEQGNPTKASKGFASGQGVKVENLESRDTDRGEYLFAVIEKKGREVIDLLPEIFKKIIISLKFPISMRWGNYDFEFIRPLHWLLGLYDQQIINFEVSYLISDRVSRGHRFLANKNISIDSVCEYIDKLRENYVIVDPVERKKLIIDGIRSIEEEIEGNVNIDEKLLEEVVHLVEYPTVFSGEFDRRYLKMPDPVLVTPIKEHQRYFIVRDKKGKLKPNFIAVRDGSEDYLDVVRDGNEKVIKARLDDAEFYFEKDRKVNMEERIKQLKGLVFVEELGSMYDKVERIEKLVNYLAEKTGVSKDEYRRSKRAARLCKADLVSHMVREFSELQGVIGSEYAALEGEEQQVCKAIFEHYLPRYAGDKLPRTKEGRLLSIADKIDTLVGSFGMGMIPTGSEDPYGLRRAATGLVRIFKEAEIDISLKDLINTSYQNYNNLKREKEEVISDVQNFSLERVEFILGEKGNKHDVIEAILSDKEKNIPAIFALANTYKTIRDEQMLAKMATAYTRIQNIAGDWQQGDIKRDFFQEKIEEELYKKYLETKNNIMYIKKDNDYLQIYTELQKLINPIHEFFESVMVMAEDNNVRENRLNLLSAIYNLMNMMGDMSRIIMD